jgi:hypothetical protein
VPHNNAALIILHATALDRQPDRAGTPRDPTPAAASFQGSEMNRPEQPFISVEKVSSNTAL